MGGDVRMFGLCQSWCDIVFIDGAGQPSLTALQCAKSIVDHDPESDRRIHRAAFLIFGLVQMSGDPPDVALLLYGCVCVLLWGALRIGLGL